ncbi:MAG: Ig-like domain-containing protein [Muribaculaceae bacterium]|nr:Ig-like domain-containing protein [Muribaculaceae bacterium]
MKKFLLSLATVALATTGAMADEVSFNFTGTGTTPAYGIARQTANSPTALPDPTTVSDGGVDITFTAGGNGGWALAVNKMITNSGMQLLTSGANHELTITAGGGLISKAVVTLNKAMEITVNGETQTIASYTWEGASTSVAFDFGTPATLTYVKTVDVTYAAASGDKQLPGLAFSESSVKAFMGQTFAAPTFSNPNNLPITWTSSKTDVATVDANGNVTLAGGGTTTIMAFTEGNDAYASGYVTYTLTVVPEATNAAQLATVAPNKGDEVTINFPITIVYSFPDLSRLWGIDPEGNPISLSFTFAKNTYGAGKVIPAGWVATNSDNSGDVTFKGEVPAVNTGAAQDITYSEVKAISPADANKVVWLENVDFTAAGTPGVGETFNVEANGNPVRVTNYFSIEEQAAGYYNTLGVVIRRVSSTTGVESVIFYPIEYKEVAAPAPMVEKNEILDLTKIKGATSSVQPISTPFTVPGKEITLTLTETEGADQYSTRGIQLRPVKAYSTAGTSTFLVSAKDREISKIVMSCGQLESCTAAGTAMTETYDNATYTYNYTWERPTDYTQNDVEIKATVLNGNQWFTSIQVYYMEQGSGKPLAELAITNQNVTVSLAEKSYDLASNLVNPHEVAVTWTSSDENVVSVNGNTAEFKGAGEVEMTATVATDEYEADTVSFFLNISDEAFTIQQMEILAPEAGDKVKLAKSLTLYVAGSAEGTYTATETTTDEEGNETTTTSTKYEGYVFCADAKGNPVVLYLNNETTAPKYRVDDIFEGGWTATNAATSTMQLWTGRKGAANSRAQGWFDNMSQVNNLNGLIENQVVVLKNVTLPSGFPKSKGEYVGKLEDGSVVALVNLVNSSTAVERGVYNIHGALGKNALGNDVFYALSFDTVELLDPEFPNEVVVTTDGDAVIISQEYEDGQIFINLTGETSKSTLEVTLAVPEGWTGYVGANFADLGMGTSILRSSKDDDDPNWVPVEMFMEGMGGLKETNTLTFQLTSAGAPFMGGMYLYYGEKVYVAGSIVIQGEVKSGTVGVAAVEAVDADATYFNLQGVEVKNPAAGVYVKVANGKASKVVIR